MGGGSCAHAAGTARTIVKPIICSKQVTLRDMIFSCGF
jgi:hypothetical protein